MTGSLKAQAKRIDALSLRERIIMFVSIALAFVAVATAAASLFLLQPGNIM